MGRAKELKSVKGSAGPSAAGGASAFWVIRIYFSENFS